MCERRGEQRPTVHGEFSSLKDWGLTGCSELLVKKNIYIFRFDLDIFKYFTF